MINKRLARDIYNLLEDIRKNIIKNIYIYFDENNLMNIKLLIKGNKNTPYEYGYYLFDVNINNDYPFKSPSVHFLTTNSSCRMHPNLYSNGKVCLSILGTWPGPSWTPTMTLSTVALSLLSLLDEEPLKNEPGYENCKGKHLNKYNNTVTFLKYNVAIHDSLKNNYKLTKNFKIIIERNFLKDFKFMKKNLKKLSKKFEENELITSSVYSLKYKSNYNYLLNTFDKLNVKIKDKYNNIDINNFNNFRFNINQILNICYINIKHDSNYNIEDNFKEKNKIYNKYTNEKYENNNFEDDFELDIDDIIENMFYFSKNKNIKNNFKDFLEELKLEDLRIINTFTKINYNKKNKLIRKSIKNKKYNLIK